jgi:arylformamidase
MTYGDAMAVEYRVQFDAEVTFVNGGGLQAQGFRLDIPNEDIDEADLAAAFVRHLGLLLVDEIRITGKSVFVEPHRGSRGMTAVPPPTGPHRLVDLSHPIHDGMITFPGLPGPEITDHLSREASRSRYAPGTEFHIGRISMVANTGTYVDTTSHRYSDGVDLAGTPLERLADLPGVLVRVPADTTAIDRLLLAPYELAGRAVVIHTGWDRHWGTAHYGAGGHPYLTAGAATFLVEAGARLVGIDSVSVDDLTDGVRPAHTILLRHDIPLVEHMRGLEALPPQGFRLHAAAPRIAGLGTFPVRAYAVCPASS